MFWECSISWWELERHFQITNKEIKQKKKHLHDYVKFAYSIIQYLVMDRETVNGETHRRAAWRSWETIVLQISVSLMRQKTEAITLRTRITQGLGNQNITIKT